MSLLLSNARPEIKAFTAEVRARANAQYDTPQSKRHYAVPLTIERARLRAVQMALWTLNRRDCWAFAQALAPFEVKRMIWKHEEDELDGNKERGVEDHFALQIQQGELLNLKPEDFHDARMTAATRTCTYAWIHLVKDSHWLKAVSACCALEISNSSEWVDGGGGSYRMGLAQEKELGIPFEKQVDNKEHTEVEVEHAHMLIQIANRYGTTREALDLMLEGLIESWEISTIWKGLLADMMEAIPAK